METHLLAIYLDTLYLITGERLSIFIKDIPFEASPTYNSILTRLGVIMPHLKISKEGQGKQISDILEKIFYMLKNNKKPEYKKYKDSNQILNMVRNFNLHEEVIMHNSNGGLIFEKKTRDELDKQEKKPEK